MEEELIKIIRKMEAAGESKQTISAVVKAYTESEVKKKGISEPVGDTEGTMDSTTEQAPASPFFLDSQSSDPITERGIGFEEPVASEKEIEFQKPSTFDPSTFVMPEDDESVIMDATAASRSKQEFEEKYLQKSQEKFQKAVDAGLIGDNSDYEKLFPDAMKDVFNEIQAERRFVTNYADLDEKVKGLISSGLIVENGEVTGVDYNLISKKNIKKIVTHYEKSDSIFENPFNESTGSVAGTLSAKANEEYNIKEKQAYYMLEELKNTKVALDLLYEASPSGPLKEGMFIKDPLLQKEAELLAKQNNETLIQLKRIKRELDEDSIMINSLDIIEKNTTLPGLVSTGFSALTTMGGYLAAMLPNLHARSELVSLGDAAKRLEWMKENPIIYPEGVEIGSKEWSKIYWDYQKRAIKETPNQRQEELMKTSLEIFETVKETLPTDYRDSNYNFAGEVLGQLGFQITVSRLGGATGIPLGGSMASVGAGYSMSSMEMYKDATESGLDHHDAMKLADNYAMISAPLEMIPVSSGLSKAATKAGLKTARKKAIDNILKKGAKDFTEDIASREVTLSLKPLFKSAGVDFIEEGGQEALQYNIGLGLAKNYNANKEDSQKEFVKEDFGSSEYWGNLNQNFLLGGAAGSMIGPITSIIGGEFRVGSNYNALEEMFLDPKQMSKINDQLTAYRRLGKIETDEDLQVAREQVGIVQSAAAEVSNATKARPDKVGEVQKKRLFQLTAERLSIQKEIEGVATPSLVSDRKQRIEELDQEITDVISGKITEKQILASLSVTPEVSETAPVAEEAVAEEVVAEAAPVAEEAQEFKVGDIITPDIIVRDELSVGGENETFIGDVIEEGNKQNKATKIIKINGVSERGTSVGIRVVTEDGTIEQTVFLKSEAAPVAEEVEQIALEEPSESQLQDDVKNGEVVTLTFENENDIPDVYKDKTKVKNSIRNTGTTQVGRRGKPKSTIRVTVEKSLVDYHESTKQVAEEAALSKKVDAVFAEKNPDKVEVLSGNLARNKSSKFKPSEITQKYIGQATRAAKAIQKIAPKVRVVLHDTTEEYSSFGTKGSRGMYDPVSKTIHIDLSKANKNTIGHEMFHSILFNTIGTEKDIQAATDDMYKSVKRSLATNPIMKRKLRKFSENYGENIQSEEALSELFGMLSSDYKQLNAPTKVKIKQFINKIASKFGLTDIINLSEQDLSDLETIELLNTIAARVKEGESITEEDVETLDNGTNPIGTPTEINLPSERKQIEFKESYENSLVTPDKSLDFYKLLEDISAKKQKVWFWVADQLGINEEMGIDGGPSFAHQKPNDIWASSMPLKRIRDNIDKTSYIFIISGSPTVSKLFSKTAYDYITSKLGDFNNFKTKALETKPSKVIRETLEKYNSWEELRESTDRKPFLIALNNSQSTINTAFTKYVNSINGYTDLGSLRDGFYKENNFEQNDIMLVLKPTGAREGSNHSTYSNTIEGEVIGVPDIKVDAFEIMPEEMRKKYEGKGKAQQSSVVAPYGSGVRDVATPATREQKIPQKTKNRIDDIIKRVKSKAKYTDPNVILEKVVDNVQSLDKWYEGANDTQREDTVRYIRELLGLKEKATPFSKIFTLITDITKIDLKEQIDIARSLKQRAKLTAKEKKILYDSLNDTLKELEGSGKLTTAQVKTVIKKFNNVDVFSQAQVDDFVDYMTKVFADADYMSKMATAKNKIPRARRNIKSKTGMNPVGPLLDRLFRINPRIIPSQFLDDYLGILDTMSKNKSELDFSELDLISKNTQEILNYMDGEGSKVYWLSSGYQDYINENKVKVRGKTFNEILDFMKTATIIDDNDIAIMKKYKTTISPSERAKKTEAEIQEEKDSLIEDIKLKSKETNPIFSTNDEKLFADKFKRLVKTKAIDELSLNELKTLLQTLTNVNQGLVSSNVALFNAKLNSISNSKIVSNSLAKATLGLVTKAYNKVKEKLSSSKNYVQKALESSPLYYIDLVFGDGKSRALFDSIFKELAEAEQNFNFDLITNRKKFTKASDAVLKSLKGNNNKFNKSSAKQMLYMLQLEYLSNPNNNMFSALEYLDETISLSSKLSKGDLEMLREIRKEFAEDFNEDIDKLYSSFSKAEKESIKTIQEINFSLSENAAFTAGVIRGNRIELLNNYVHHVVVSDKFDGKKIDDDQSLMTNFNDSLKPSTKAKSLIERKNVLTPLNFDIYNSVNRGSKTTLIDYHLTVPIKTARMTMKLTKKELESNGLYDGKKEIYEGLESLVENTIETFIRNNVAATSGFEMGVAKIAKIGYQRVLGDTGRMVKEIISNIGFIVNRGRNEWARGMKHNSVGEETVSQAMRNLNSLVTGRLYTDAGIQSRFAEKLTEANAGVRGNKNKSTVRNVLGIINYHSGKPIYNFADAVADAVISKPDQMMTRPLWKGTFDLTFEKETGKPFPADGFERIAANDQAFMSEYKGALKIATAKADDTTVEAGASSGLFTGVTRGKDYKSESSGMKSTLKYLFANFNGYMSNFLNFEYTAFRKGLNASMDNGEITRKEGRQLMAAVATRMTLYTFLGSVITKGALSVLLGLLGLIDDEEEDDDKGLGKKFMSSVVQTGIALLVGRNFGNAFKAIQNLIIEDVNEKYLDVLRDGEYNKYEDSLGYTISPKKKPYEDTKLEQFVIPLSGPFGKFLNSFNAAIKVGNDFLKPSDTAAGIEKQNTRKWKLLISDIPSTLGMNPLAKEVEKEFNKELYKNNDVKFAKSSKTSMTDLKEFAPDLYDELKKLEDDLKDLEVDID